MTEVTKKFKPFYEQRMAGWPADPELTQFEKDELMFEDAEFLNKYFTDMRDKIAEDIQNIDRYFPAHATLDHSKLYTSPHTPHKQRHLS